MASTKISQLPATTAITQTDIAAVVDNGFTTTSKITKSNLFRAKGGSVSTGSVANGSSDLLATDSSEIRNNSTTSAVVASYGSYIDDGQNHFIGGANGCSIQTGAAGHGAIVGSDSVSITGGYNNLIGGSYNGPNISGGEENVILASFGGCAIQGGGNNFIAAAQGFVMGSNSYKNAGIAAEAGGWAGPRFSFAGGGYNLTSNSANGNQLAGLAYNGLTFDSLGSYIYHSAGVAVESGTINKTTSALIASSGKTTQYDYTLHTDNTYVWGHQTHPNTITTTISNVQYFNADNGMVQYCDVSAGNLNLTFENIRNGEVYDWIIDNTSGGSISLNSVAYPIGFSSSHNISGGGVSVGPNMFRIVVINDVVYIRIIP